MRSEVIGLRWWLLCRECVWGGGRRDLLCVLGLSAYLYFMCCDAKPVRWFFISSLKQLKYFFKNWNLEVYTHIFITTTYSHIIFPVSCSPCMQLWPAVKKLTPWPLSNREVWYITSHSSICNHNCCLNATFSCMKWNIVGHQTGYQHSDL